MIEKAQKHYECLEHLRSLMNSQVTDHSLMLLAESCYRNIDITVFKRSCRTLSQSFEVKGYKTFPNLKDFMAFRANSVEFQSWQIEYAAILEIEPSQLPKHAKYLKQSDRDKLGLLGFDKQKKLFDKLKTIIGKQWPGFYREPEPIVKEPLSVEEEVIQL